MTPGSAPDPIAEFPVRTAPGYWLVGGALAVLAVLGAAMLAFLATTTGVPGGVAIGVAALAAAAPVAYWTLTPAFRIGGGRGVIRLFADRIEVPAARARSPIVLDRAALIASATEQRIRYQVGPMMAATVRRGHLVDLRAGDRRRVISTLTIDRPKAFLDALARYLGD